MDPSFPGYLNGKLSDRKTKLAAYWWEGYQWTVDFWGQSKQQQNANYVKDAYSVCFAI